MSTSTNVVACELVRVSDESEAIIIPKWLISDKRNVILVSLLIIDCLAPEQCDTDMT